MLAIAEIKLRKLFSTLFGDSADIIFENRLFNISTLVGVFLCIIMIVSNLVVGINNILNIALAFLAGLYCVFFYYGRFKNRFRAFVPYYILSTQFLLIMAWIFNSGSYGPVSFIFISFLLVTIGIVPVNQHGKWFAVVLISYLIAFSIEIFMPGYIKGYESIEQRHLDLILTFFIAFGFAYFFIRVLKINYAIEHQMALKQKQLIENQNAYLENANLVKDRLFSVLAHDLRSPLSSLKAMINVFEDEIKENYEMNEIAHAIDQRLTYNLQLLDDLMLWSKSQMTGSKMMKTYFNLCLVFKDSYEILKRNAEQKQVAFENDIPDDFQILADANSIRAVLRNLISNAIKFCMPGGKVKLSAFETDKAYIINVVDNGVGMSAEQTNKLFTELHLSTDGTLSERGSGLGLLLVKDFIEQNGGYLSLKSSSGEGTSVEIYLPKEGDLLIK